MIMTGKAIKGKERLVDIPKARYRQFKSFMKDPKKGKRFVKAVKKLRGPLGKAFAVSAAGGAIGGMLGYGHATKK